MGDIDLNYYREFSIDHEPDGWPAFQMKEITAMCDEIESLRTRLEASTAQCERLRKYIADGATYNMNRDKCPRRAILDETPEQSLAEIEARAIESLADEMDEVIDGKPAIGVVASSWLRFRAARLRQQAKEKSE